MNDRDRLRFEDSWVAWDMNESDVVSAEIPQVSSTVVRFAWSAARSIDPRDRTQPLFYRPDENYKKGE